MYAGREWSERRAWLVPTIGTAVFDDVEDDDGADAEREPNGGDDGCCDCDVHVDPPCGSRRNQGPEQRVRGTEFVPITTLRSICPASSATPVTHLVVGCALVSWSRCIASARRDTGDDVRHSRRSLVNLLGVAIGLAGLGFVGYRIARDWDELTATLDSARPAWLVAAVVAGLVSMSAIGVNWLSLIRRRGHAARPQRGLSWFFIGQLGKYVPGGIWPVVGQAELAARNGTDRRSAYLATASSMTFTLLAAVAVAAICGLASPYDRALTAALLAVGIVVVLVSLVVPRLRAWLVRAAAAVTRGRGGRVELPEAPVVAEYTLRHLPVWVMFGLMYICVFVALGGDLDLGLAVDLVFASALSWIVGFVIIGVPGGIGVRESVFVGLMTGPIGATLALSVAVAARLVTIGVDLSGALGAACLARFSTSGSVRSPLDAAPDEADHPDPVLQRGSDAAADGGRPAP